MREDIGHLAYRRANLIRQYNWCIKYWCTNDRNGLLEELKKLMSEIFHCDGILRNYREDLITLHNAEIARMQRERQRREERELVLAAPAA